MKRKGHGVRGWIFIKFLEFGHGAAMWRCAGCGAVYSTSHGPSSACWEPAKRNCPNRWKAPDAEGG